MNDRIKDKVKFHVIDRGRKHSDDQLVSRITSYNVCYTKLLRIEQTERKDVSEDHIQKCMEKVSVLQQKRKDLESILEQFLEEIASGKRAYRVYFQFKMYNDPSLNPQLYSKKS